MKWIIKITTDEQDKALVNYLNKTNKPRLSFGFWGYHHIWFSNTPFNEPILLDNKSLYSYSIDNPCPDFQEITYDQFVESVLGDKPFKKENQAHDSNLEAIYLKLLQ